MIKFPFKRTLIVLFTVIISCTSSEETEIILPEITVETIKVKNDQKLLQLIESNLGTVPKGRTMSSKFGELDLENAIRVNIPELNTTRYSLSLSNLNNSNGFDNYIIKNSKDKISQYIISYQPDLNWLLNNKDDLDWSKYTGAINAYEINGTVITEDYLIDGVSKFHSDRGRIEDCYECTFTTMEYSRSYFSNK
ncbi:hypothetical protein [Ekhidna sp.]|uniref:hypothetical protein n=1 Tax=Ekhidna sp. TaxID=2608089 RepID=UPI0032968307